MALKSKAGSDWDTLPDTIQRPKRGIFMNVDGGEGSGKTSLALTLARCGQVAYIDIDQSVDRARRSKDKKAKGRVKIHEVRYVAGGGEEEVKKSCAGAYLPMEKKLKEAAASWADGAVIDTDTELWEILRLASFGTLNPKANRLDRLYGPVNARFRQLHRTIYRGNAKHLITVHQIKDEYVDKKDDQGRDVSKKTGRQVRTGFKEIGYLCDLSIRCFKEGGEFKALVEVNKLAPNGPDMEGIILEGDDLDFARIVAMSTETEEEEWLK